MDKEREVKEIRMRAKEKKNTLEKIPLHDLSTNNKTSDVLVSFFT